MPRRLIEVAVGRMLENRRHIRRDRVGPRIAVIPCVVVHQMTKVSDKGSIRRHRQKDVVEPRDRVVREAAPVVGMPQHPHGRRDDRSERVLRPDRLPQARGEGDEAPVSQRFGRDDARLDIEGE